MAELRGLDAVARQARLATEASERPWPLPDGLWAQAQIRSNSLHACWRVDLGALARLLPSELAVDTFEGEAWLALVASRVASLRVRGLPPMPGLSSFLQLEVGTFATLDGKPGVWLFSLELTKPLLVEAAKRAHRLPAYRARIAVADEPEGTRFDADRDGLRFGAGFTAAGPVHEPRPGTLERFLTDRYALYTADGGRLYRADLHHSPTRLQAVEAVVDAATISPVLLEGDPVVLFVPEQDVLVWPLEEL